MSTLHTINKSPFSHATLASCLEVCGNKDGLLLLEDGVFGALNSSPCAKELSTLINSGVKVYVLSNDVNARGLQEKLRNDVLTTDYNGFVQLSIEYNCVQSWY